MKNPVLPISIVMAIAGALFASALLPPVASGAPAEATPDNATAYRAIRVARGALGAEALDRLVEVTGQDGVPQPYVWKIVLKEGAAGSKEIDVADGKIVAQRSLGRPPANSGLVRLKELNLDSSGAFDAADTQSRKARVRFDSVNYTLRANETGKPVWTLELFNQNGAGVGNMRLTATDGVIASIDGRLAQAPGRPGEPMTASTSTNPAPARTISTTTTTIETAPAPVPPPPNAPPPVHDVDVAVAPPPPDNGEGGFFTRAGRTLDHAHDNVAHAIDTAHDNVAHTLDTVHDNVDHTLRSTGAKVQRFFTGHSDLDQE